MGFVSINSNFLSLYVDFCYYFVVKNVQYARSFVIIILSLKSVGQEQLPHHFSRSNKFSSANTKVGAGLSNFGQI